MPVTKQAIKKVRQDKRKTAVNLRVKKAYKTTVQTFRKNPTAATLVGAFKALDRAAKVNMIHKNKAARLKSRLSKRLSGKISPSVALKKTAKKSASKKKNTKKS
jgi:small subunit ribosomal protein S20